MQIKKLFIILIIVFIGFIVFIQVNNGKDFKNEDKKVEEVQGEPLTVADKKKNFIKTFVPAITYVYTTLYQEFIETKKLINTNPTHKKLIKLQKEYNVNSNKELLVALKPHPISIALAQAAIESGWGTSRFFKEAKNVFGVWSFNKNEPRIAAGKKRGEKTVYLKKFSSVEDSIKNYYKILSSNKAYRDFKKANYNNENPLNIAKHLMNYSEQKEEYIRKVTSVLKYNKFTKYDKHY